MERSIFPERSRELRRRIRRARRRRMQPLLNEAEGEEEVAVSVHEGACACVQGDGAERGEQDDGLDLQAVVRDFAGQLGALTERLAAMEGRMTHLEESVERSLAVVLPKVDSLLRGMEGRRAASSSEQTTENGDWATQERARDGATQERSRDGATQECAPGDQTEGIPGKLARAVAASGDLDSLLNIIELHGSNVITARNDRGDTALHAAALAGQVGSLEILLDTIEDGANFCGWHLRTPLHVAAAEGHTDAVLSLLSSGALVDAADAKGATPLHLAAECGMGNVATLLLVEGAAPRIADVLGRIPLHYAAANGHATVISALLQHQGSEDVDVMDQRAVTPIMLAAFHGHIQTLQVLLEKGASLESTDADGRTALHHAALAPEDDRGQTVTLALLAAGASVDANDIQGRTPLWEAARCGHTGVLQSLLEGGASPNAYNAAGISPLEAASAEGHGSTVAALLRAGAPSDDQQLRRALAVSESADVVWSLASAAPGMVRTAGGQALWQALRHNRPAVVAALLDAGVSPHAPSEEETHDDDDSGACCGGQNSLDLDSLTPLEMAAALGYADCLSVLLTHGATSSTETNSTTPLHLTAVGGHTASLNVLLNNADSKAFVNKRDAGGNTPLHLAADKGHLQCVAALLAAGSDPCVQNALGHVPKGLQDRHAEVADLLLAAVRTRST